MELQDHPGPICAPVRFVTVIWKKALSSGGAVLGTVAPSPATPLRAERSGQGPDAGCEPPPGSAGGSAVSSRPRDRRGAPEGAPKVRPTHMSARPRRVATPPDAPTHRSSSPPHVSRWMSIEYGWTFAPYRAISHPHLTPPARRRGGDLPIPVVGPPFHRDSGFEAAGSGERGSGVGDRCCSN